MNDPLLHSSLADKDDDGPVARAIASFVRVSVPITLLWAVACIALAPRLTRSIVVEAGAFVAIALGSLGLVSLHRTRLAGVFLSGAFWCLLAWFSYTNGGVHSAAFSSFAAIILMTGVLWSTRAAFVMTAVTMLLGALFVLLDTRHALPPAWENDSALSVWLGACTTFIIIATLQHLAARVARENLARAHDENAQRKLAEQESLQVSRALEQSERRYQHIFESAAIALFEMDFSELLPWRERWSAQHVGQDLRASLDSEPGLIDEISRRAQTLDANSAALSMLELDEKRMLLGSLEARFVAEARKSVVQLALELTESTALVQRELTVKTFRGRQRRVLLTGRAPALVERRDRLVVSALDLTDQRLREERGRAMQRLEAIGRLAGGVAHDFNNALVVIISWANMLRRPGRTDAERAEGLAAITESATRAAELVRRLLSMGQNEVRAPRPTRIAAIIDETVVALARLLPADIRVSVDAGPGGRVMVDDAQLQQVLLNLALNARDAMPKGGQLEFRTRVAERTAVADLDLDAQYLEISVRDTGIGMDRATQERIFEPFFSTKGEGRGTGLGLATAHAVISESRGKISVQSELGKGSCFSVYLPITEQDATPTPQTVQRSLDGRGRTILVVEDEVLVRSVLVETLAAAGYHVLEAGDGKSALKLAAAQDTAIDLLCTDGILPGMATRDLIDEFVELFPSAPVLVCSGHVQEELVRRSIASGEFAFLAKPFPPEELVRRIEELLHTGKGSPFS